MNISRAFCFCGSACLVLLLAPHSALADHESPEAIFGQWQSWGPRMHILKPAKEVRRLAPSRNQEAVERMLEQAKRFAEKTLATLIIEGGDLLFEGYARGAAHDTKLNAYSMTKSLTALAVGEAYCAGKIKSLDDPATRYAPQLEGTAYGAASLKNLLKYTSGAQDPGGNGYVGIHNMPDFRAMTEHRLSLLGLLKKYGGASRFNPGEKFIYNGLDSEALSLVVREATGMPLPQWFEGTVWQKAGGEFPAGWFVDREGNGVAEALLLATARDFARIGLYILDRLTGKSNDECMNGFIKDAATAHVHKGYWEPAPRFGLGLHVGADGNTWLFGHGGQRVGINARTGRVLTTNGSRQWPGYDTEVQQLLAH